MRTRTFTPQAFYLMVLIYIGILALTVFIVYA